MLREDTFAYCEGLWDDEGNKISQDRKNVNGTKISASTLASVSAVHKFGLARGVMCLSKTYSNLKQNTCYTCNGYYGPCFDDPICATCHAFLFPNAPPTMEGSSTLDNSSDSDSGNDEPVDNSQENVTPCPFQDWTRKMAPVRVDTLASALQRLSVISHQLPISLNLEHFPPEVLIHMFQYLDEISLWSIGQVCSRWREILFMCVKSERWRSFVNLRWPLLPMNYLVNQNWYELYTAMMLSSCCFKCVKQMGAQQLPANWEESSWRRHRLRSEIKAMRNDPLDGIEAAPLDLLCCHWQATIEGPAGSPYEGGLFFLYIQVPQSYPLDPPVVRFLTKIFHPNISRHGDIGIDSIHDNWSLALTISKLLISIQSLLTDPFCDVCMEPDIGTLYLRDRAAFEEQARLWTAVHAMHDIMRH